MRLSEMAEAYPRLKQYVEFLKDYLTRPPEEVEVYKMDEAEKLGYQVDERMLGAAAGDKLFFKEVPPDVNTFIHELIHLCKKPPVVHEEVFAYDLTNIIIFCVEKDIKCDPFKLFTLRVEDIERVLRKYGIGSIEEYYTVAGIIPINYIIEFDESGRVASVAPSAELLSHPERERIIVETFIIELAGGVPFYAEGSVEERILIDLCRLCA